jgi:sec-independent protein translocase protein TatA
MFGLRLPELLIILVVVLVIFGGSRLPQLGKALGETTRNFRKAAGQGRSEGEEEKDRDQVPK